MLSLTRFFEILPALLAWTTILFPLVFLTTFPTFIAFFILLYVFLWFTRAMEFAFFLFLAFRKYKRALKKDWQAEWKKAEQEADLKPSEVIHLIILPTYKEDISVLRESVQSIVDSEINHEQLYLCLATEERDAERGRKNAEILKQEFGDQLGRYFWFEHPKDLPNEVIGKGGNITFAGQQVEQELRADGIALERVIVTTLDADNKVSPCLFSALTVTYCRTPKRKHCSFQPLPLFLNNLWSVPIINRMVAISSSFWHLIESGRPDRLRNFSSHSQPLAALAEMDYWDKTTIVEDGRQYFRSYLHFDGDYRVIPIFLPIYQDAVLGNTYMRSLGDQFAQLRRWAWGASDLSYFTMGILEHWKKLPFWKTFLQYFRLLEGHYMWATAAIFLTVSTFITRSDYVLENSVVGSHLFVFLSVIFKVALLGICVSIILTFILLPPPPKKMHRLSLLLQWIFLPIVTILFGSIPALYAQTQLALGKKMKFNVTKKIRRK